MNTNEVNAAISRYLEAKEKQSAADKAAREAKKAADMAADIIKRFAAGRASFETDAYTVGIAESVAIVLDTEKLYADFKDIKSLDQYGKESPRVKITAIARQQADAASA